MVSVPAWKLSRRISPPVINGPAAKVGDADRSAMMLGVPQIWQTDVIEAA